MKIVPTIGRVVLYFPSETDRLEGMEVISPEPCTALITYVWSDTCINVVAFDHDGEAWPRRRVAINVADAGEGRAEWMVYQQGQAAKADKAEAALAAARAS